MVDFVFPAVKYMFDCVLICLCMFQIAPSVVRNLKVTEKGSHHLKVSWDKPAEENGILRRYVVEYKGFFCIRCIISACYIDWTFCILLCL